MARTFYKYVNIEVLSFILGGTIRFTQPSAFNDPFEMPAFRIFEERVGKLGGLMGVTADTIASLTATSSAVSGLSGIPLPPFMAAWSAPVDRSDRAERDADETRAIAAKLKEVDARYVILSLCRTDTNLLMWAHYADQHRGAVVEIDIDAPGFLEPTDVHRNVFYVTARPAIAPDQRTIVDYLFKKSVDWDYEREYRIVRDRAGRDSALADNKGHPLHVFPVPPAAIRSVTFGERFREQDGKAVLARLADPAFAHVARRRATIMGDRYGIAFQAIG